MIEPLLAGFVLALSLLALARLALGERRRARLDAAVQRAWARLSGRFRRRGTRQTSARGATRASPQQAARRAGVSGPAAASASSPTTLRAARRRAPPAAAEPEQGGLFGLFGLVALWRRLRQRAAQRAAEKQAAREAEALIRRARDGHWEGNVYRPKAFDERSRRGSEAPGRGPSDTLH